MIQNDRSLPLCVYRCVCILILLNFRSSISNTSEIYLLRNYNLDHHYGDEIKHKTVANYKISAFPFGAFHEINLL
uniref:Uncharacterized protein n=1 Tax=Octopus bimaculoides TaxID=37653 RepID=A0A0L8GR28_OCTBM